ncbi:MAG: tetratricopeptide repeat protein, partial [Rhodospirillales bacterium]|nr:tetratricopeptide repeat protein [Rhodospirillales bacterium]
MYSAQDRLSDAVSLIKRSLAITEKAVGSQHPDMATRLNNLASLYRDQGRYAAAEPLYKQSLAIWEKALGPQHPNVGAGLNNLAEL